MCLISFSSNILFFCRCALVSVAMTKPLWLYVIRTQPHSRSRTVSDRFVKTWPPRRLSNLAWPVETLATNRYGHNHQHLVLVFIYNDYFYLVEAKVAVKDIALHCWQNLGNWANLKSRGSLASTWASPPDTELQMCTCKTVTCSGCSHG